MNTQNAVKQHKASIIILRQPYYCLVWLFIFLTGSGNVFAQAKNTEPLPPLTVAKNGHLIYNPDSLGNRIPNFSYCGYKASEQSIPDVPVKIVVPLTTGDATLRIQSAIDYVANLPLDKNGFRGTVLLQKGTYNISGQLKIEASGIVLRGSGMNDGTVLLGTGLGRETLIRINGKNDKTTGTEIKITDVYVPVNANKFHVQNASFKKGDFITIHRPSTKNWISLLGTETFGGGISALGWKPGERDIYWDRKVVAVNGNTITIDASITTALDTTYGGGTVAAYNWPGRITNVGIENLTCQSTYDETNPKDEAHRWMAITMENVMDAWVRQVVFKHFAGSAVDILATAKRITVEDCKSLSPISEIGGQRRYTFLTAGQQTLIQRCYAERGYHDFAVGFCVPGPNAFVQCESRQPYSFSGTIQSWASGVLFDIVNIDGQALRFDNRGQDGQGAGWTAANSVFWQCSAALIDCYKPPTANNYSYGSWSQFNGDGYWESSNEHVNPRSLFYAQLQERLGKDVSHASFLLPITSEASSSPTVAVAAQLTAEAANPAPLLSDWIDESDKRNPIPVDAAGAKKIDEVGVEKMPVIANAPTLHIENGWLVRGNRVVTGGRLDVPWWNGSVQPKDLPKMKPAITRFVPGRIGKGLTDELDEETDNMEKNHIVAVEQNYPLWYDRRLDDHERVRRMNGEVWPPFYEMPFARSGKDTAWDGLSKYDLTKYNPWYWSRLKQFANLADQKGLVLIHQNYFQHNIIEAGAHYANFTWRPVNNINNTGFPEPPPYAGDKRIFLAHQFYDETNPSRKPLHEAYIRQCLNNFKDNNGVIQFTAAEFTGPRHFVAFWLDVIEQWEKENSKKEIIGLSTTKDVQDSILADPERAPVVDIIDIRQWHYQANGSLYAPKGGASLAPRQWARLLKPKASSFEQVYRAVLEYRQKYPGKAVMYSADGYDRFGWAAFMAGGSLAAIPRIYDAKFLEDASSMLPVFNSLNAGEYILAKKDGYIVYGKGSVKVDLSKSSGRFNASWIDPKTGKEKKEQNVRGGKIIDLKCPVDSEVILWLHK
jgi:hypothetical protein